MDRVMMVTMAMMVVTATTTTTGWLHGNSWLVSEDRMGSCQTMWRILGCRERICTGRL
jgi:hypothetical protein